MYLHNLSLSIVFLPLLASILVGLNTNKIKPIIAQIITVSFVSIAAIFSWIIFYYICFCGQIIHLKLINWFNLGELKADWSIYIDPLTAIMFLVVNTVSALVHIYSVGYMSHDPNQPRFFSYLSLFTFFMLILVSADNFAQLFVGWEGVGLSSYLLIGFWFHKKSAYSAAIKAFLVNRVGDIGLAIGIFLTAMKFGSVEYATVFSKAKYLAEETINFLSFDIGLLTAICIAIFIGCMGKSAQLGLHTWLPDAMEGPTPVSALIHAATMVTAGVFLLTRCSYLFEYSEIALGLVTIVGAATCLFAATIAIAQNDTKKIIAYSTCSQLGYMFFACGVSAYSAGIFHLLTHAFFKALLFLGAGSIIHALADEQDIKKMGGTWRKLPYTHALMWIGSIALVGIPPLSGFFSKDLILEAAYASGSKFGNLAYWLGVAAAALTAFYSCRLLFLVFYGPTNVDKKIFTEIHEAPKSMMIPLIVLGIGSLICGYIGYHIIDISNLPFWSGAIFVLQEHDSINKIDTIEHWVVQLPLLAALFSMLLAYYAYILKPIISSWSYKNFRNINSFLEKQWYFDEVYELILVKPVKLLGMSLWRFIDAGLIDGILNYSARAVAKFAKVACLLQTGYIYHYAMVMLIGVMILVYWYLPW
ncbi:MAG: NADH-quinone oxidoreductase subunit L [Candidatus Midichloria sp.]|uniref:NADH-ubiquinone oxidoreductase chain 5 n=1 Tax=Hyalomma marginatum TaxID=34627 RepID=A0A8S4C4W8_9ACAR|nr:NADH-quinone oxidoreductase subunit L [Hyalomma marginatum]CAG7599855.1 NADH-quinone oxidoreductase subunit L [Hyalomma marginatum]